MGVEMWCRRPSICSLFLLVSGILTALLLVAVYNGQDDFSRHTPLTHNANFVNIQQKVFKAKLQPNSAKLLQGLERGQKVVAHGNDTADASWSSSGVSESEAEERASDETGDNAREVRVSSSADDDGREGSDGSEGRESDGGARDGPSSEAEEDERAGNGGRDRDRGDLAPGVRTRKEQGYGGEDEEDGKGEEDAEGDDDDDNDDDGEEDYRAGKRKQKKRKHYYHHDWDEYARNGWDRLPLRPSIADAEAQPGDAVVYNRVGKCGSRSVINIMRELASRNHFHFVSSLVYNRTRISAPHERMIVNIVGRLERPYIFQRHVHFIDFRRYRIEQPKYINIIRDPLSRMVSQYYFKRFGDGKSDRSYSGSDKFQTFDECVLRREEECMGKKSFYIIPFFCGQDDRCKDPTSWSLNEAIRNFNDHYVATGVLEELEDTFKVFEKVLPSLFDGALQVYKQTVAGEMGTKITSTLTKHKVKPSPRVVQIMKEHMRLEYIFYEYVKASFHDQKMRLGIS